MIDLSPILYYVSGAATVYLWALLETSTNARCAYDYPGPSLLQVAADAGVQVKDGDELKVTFEVVSRVFTERRKP